MLWSIFVFLVVLSILVIVHELGHFMVAKWNGIWVEEFGFGLPPRLFGKKIGETIYSINALPFGGFVRLHGEMSDPSESSGQVTKKEQAFINKPLWVKTLVIIAGVVMNFLLAIVAFGIVYSHFGIPREKGYVEIVDIIPDSPASITTITVGQKIESIDGKLVKTRGEVTDISSKGGKHILVIDGKKITVNTKYDESTKKWYMGLVLTSDETYFPPLIERPFYGAYYGIKSSFDWSKTVLTGLGNIFTSLFKGNVPKDVSGPVGVYAVVSEVSQKGTIWDLINLLGIISVNLAVLNILPFPALDGGRLVFVIIEAIFGKKVAPKFESIVHSVGMAILLIAILAITIKDIRGLISAGSISAFLNNMVK